jgi:lysozyme family protein
MSIKKSPPTFAELAPQYWQLFLDCQVCPDKLAAVKLMVTNITINRQRYLKVAPMLGTMPWWFIALVHAMESSLSFSHHLHNGDPLKARTHHVPAGRPPANPRANPKVAPSAKNPYTWEESAEDALRWMRLNSWSDWSIRGALYKLEEYNGWGYRMYHSDVLSPYLWSYTNKYTKGKYAADGKWNDQLVSAQPGAAAILRLMVDSGLVLAYDYLGDYPLPPAGTAYA